MEHLKNVFINVDDYSLVRDKKLFTLPTVRLKRLSRSRYLLGKGETRCCNVETKEEAASKNELNLRTCIDSSSTGAVIQTDPALIGTRSVLQTSSTGAVIQTEPSAVAVLQRDSNCCVEVAVKRTDNDGNESPAKCPFKSEYTSAQKIGNDHCQSFYCKSSPCKTSENVDSLKNSDQDQANSDNEIKKTICSGLQQTRSSDLIAVGAEFSNNSKTCTVPRRNTFNLNPQINEDKLPYSNGLSQISSEPVTNYEIISDEELSHQNGSNAITPSRRIAQTRSTKANVSGLELQNPFKSFSPKKPTEMNKNQMPDSSRTIGEIEQSLQLFQTDSILSKMDVNLILIREMTRRVLDSSNLTASQHQIGKPSIVNRDQQIHPYVRRSNHGNKRQMNTPTKSSIGMPSIQSFTCNDTRGLDNGDCGEVEGENISDVTQVVMSEVDEELCYTVVKPKEAANDENGLQNYELGSVQDKMQNSELRGVQDGSVNDDFEVPEMDEDFGPSEPSSEEVEDDDWRPSKTKKHKKIDSLQDKLPKKSVIQMLQRYLLGKGKTPSCHVETNKKDTSKNCLSQISSEPVKNDEMISVAGLIPYLESCESINDAGNILRGYHPPAQQASSDLNSYIISSSTAHADLTTCISGSSLPPTLKGHTEKINCPNVLGHPQSSEKEDAEFQSMTTKISGFELPVESNSIPEKLIEMIKTAVQNQMPAELFPQNHSNADTSSSRTDETELSVHLFPKQKEFPFTISRLELQNPVESFRPEKPIEMSENQMSDEIEITLQNDSNVVASSPKTTEIEQDLQLFPTLCDSVLSRINSNLRRIGKIQKNSSRHRTNRSLITNRDQPIHLHARRGNHGNERQMDNPTESIIGMSSILTFACLDDADCGEVEGDTVVKATGNEKLEDGIQNDEIEGVQDEMQNNELRGVQDGTLNNDFEVTEMDEDFVPSEPSPNSNDWSPSKTEKHKEVDSIQDKLPKLTFDPMLQRFSLGKGEINSSNVETMKKTAEMLPQNDSNAIASSRRIDQTELSLQSIPEQKDVAFQSSSADISGLELQNPVESISPEKHIGMSKNQMSDEMSVQNGSNFVASSRTIAKIEQSQPLFPAQYDSLLSTINSNILRLREITLKALDSSNLTASQHQISKPLIINRDQQIPPYVCSSNQDHGNKRHMDQPTSVGLPSILSFACNDSRGLNDRDCGQVEDEDISDVIRRVRSEVDEELCYTVVKAEEAADDENELDDGMQNNGLKGVQDGTLNDGGAIGTTDGAVKDLPTDEASESENEDFEVSDEDEDFVPSEPSSLSDEIEDDDWRPSKTKKHKKKMNKLPRNSRVASEIPDSIHNSKLGQSSNLKLSEQPVQVHQSSPGALNKERYIIDSLRGFGYANARENRDGSVSWRCINRFCRAQIKVVDGLTKMLGSHNHASDPKILSVSKQILLSTVPPKKNLEAPTSSDLTTQTVTSSHDSKFLPTVLQDFEVTEMDEDFVPSEPSPKGNDWRPSKAEKHKEVDSIQDKLPKLTFGQMLQRISLGKGEIHSSNVETTKKTAELLPQNDSNAIASSRKIDQTELSLQSIPEQKDVGFQPTSAIISGLEFKNPVESFSPEKHIEMSKNQMSDEMSVQNDSNFVASSRTIAVMEQSQKLFPAQSDSLLSTINSNLSWLREMTLKVLDSSNFTASQHQISKPSIINRDQQIHPYVRSSNQDHGNKRHMDQPTSVGLPSIQSLACNDSRGLNDRDCGEVGDEDISDVGLPSILSFACNDSRGLNDRDCGEVGDEDISDVIHLEKSEVDEELCYTVVKAEEAADDENDLDDGMQNNELGGVQDGTLNDVVKAEEAADDENELDDGMQNNELGGVQDEMQTNRLGGVQDGTLNYVYGDTVTNATTKIPQSHGGVDSPENTEVRQTRSRSRRQLVSSIPQENITSLSSGRISTTDGAAIALQTLELDKSNDSENEDFEVSEEDEDFVPSEPSSLSDEIEDDDWRPSKTKKHKKKMNKLPRNPRVASEIPDSICNSKLGQSSNLKLPEQPVQAHQSSPLIVKKYTPKKYTPLTEEKHIIDSLQGYCYEIAHENSDGSVSWRCTNRLCQAQIKVVDGLSKMLGSHNHASDPKISLASKQILLSTVPPRKNLEAPTSSDLTTQTVTSSPNDSKFLPTLQDGQMDSFEVSTPSLTNVDVPTGVRISAIDGAVKAPPTLELGEANDSEKEDFEVPKMDEDFVPSEPSSEEEEDDDWRPSKTKKHKKVHSLRKKLPERTVSKSSQGAKTFIVNSEGHLTEKSSIIDGFPYGTASGNRDGSVSYRCTKPSCQAQINVLGELVKIVSPHNHASDPKDLLDAKQNALTKVSPGKNLKTAASSLTTVTSSLDDTKDTLQLPAPISNCEGTEWNKMSCKEEPQQLGDADTKNFHSTEDSDSISHEEIPEENETVFASAVIQDEIEPNKQQSTKNMPQSSSLFKSSQAFQGNCKSQNEKVHLDAIQTTENNRTSRKQSNSSQTGIDISFLPQDIQLANDIKREPIKCRHCDSVFVSLESLIMHIETHWDRTILKYRPDFICGDCGNTFGHFDDFCRHGYTHDRLKPVGCHICGKRLANCYRTFKQHMISLHSDITFSCFLCDKLFKEKKNLNGHIRWHFNGYVLNCSKCANGFRGLHSHEFENKTKVKCNVCAKEITCGFLNKHMLVHTGEKNHICNVCGKAFLRSKGLYNHLINKHSKDKPFACELCPRKFKMKSRLTDHLRDCHSGNVYKCNQCDKVSESKKNLQTHILVSHSEEKPFACNTCGKCFVLRGYLNNHMASRHHLRIKPLERNFKCNLCDKSFFYDANLHHHKRVKHNDAFKFICDLCGKVLTRRQTLQQHMQTHQR